MNLLLDDPELGPARPTNDVDVIVEVVTCFEAGWSSLTNGDLLAMTESEFDVLVTTEKIIRYQQHLESRRIAIFVLPTTRWPQLKIHAVAIGEAIGDLNAASCEEWNFPNG